MDKQVHVGFKLQIPVKNKFLGQYTSLDTSTCTVYCLMHIYGALCLQVKCRLLYINANTKTVGLSLQENVLLNKATSFGNWSIGDIIEDAGVMRVDQGMGLLMKLSDNSLGFAHVSTRPH